MGRRGLVWVAVGVVTIAVSGAMPKRAEPTPSHLREAASRSATIKRVRIGGTRYWTVNMVKALRIIDSPYAKAISYVISACQSAGAWAFTDGFNGYGTVAYFSTDIRTCFETSGGGPGAPTRQAPCAQFYRSSNGWFVLIAGTDTDICADMSTQVPGGQRATTTDWSDNNTFGPNTLVYVTCQELGDDGTLWDYVEPWARSPLKFPRSTQADWIDDSTVDTQYQDFIPGVPRCSGVNTQF